MSYPNYEIEIRLYEASSTDELDLSAFTREDLDAITVWLQLQKEAYAGQVTNPTFELMQRQRVETLALQLHHARQLAVSKYAQNLRPNNDTDSN